MPWTNGTVMILGRLQLLSKTVRPPEDAHDSESQRCEYGMIVIFEAEERFGFVYWWLEARSTTVMEYFIT